MSNLDFWLLVEFMVLVNVGFAGAALFYWAKPISGRYSAWAIRFQEKHPQVSKPLSPKAASLNYKMIVIFCRTTGAFLLAEAVYLFVHAIKRITR